MIPKQFFIAVMLVAMNKNLLIGKKDYIWSIPEVSWTKVSDGYSSQDIRDYFMKPDTCGDIDQHNYHYQDTLQIERKLPTKSWVNRVTTFLFDMYVYGCLTEVERVYISQ